MCLIMVMYGTLAFIGKNRYHGQRGHFRKLAAINNNKFMWGNGGTHAGNKQDITMSW